MQKRRGKAWEKESRVWHQVDVRVDVRGAVTDHCNSNSANINRPRVYWTNELYWHSFECYSLKFLQGGPQDPLSGTVPLPSTLTSTWHHAYDSPRPSSPFLHTASNQKLEAGTAWEQGYFSWNKLATELETLQVLTPAPSVPSSPASVSAWRLPSPVYAGPQPSK